MQNTVAQLLIEETRFRLLEESIPRLRKCLGLLTEEEVWHRPNEQTVSVGNLVLHLCGNVRQWLISGLGGAEDHRNRPQEFEEKGPIPKLELNLMLDLLVTDTQQIIGELPNLDLTENRTIQGRSVSGVSILVHVVEHFSYHVGQVSYFVKSGKNIDLEYFKGQDLNQKNSPL